MAYRNGDFSGALTGRVLGTDPLGRPIMENAIYDPRTTRVVNGQVVRDPFPNNRIPTEMLDPVALKIQALIPAPDNGERLNNYGPNVENHRYQSIPTIKIDHNVGSATKLSGYYSAQFTDQITGPDGMPIPITARRDQKIYGHTVRVNADKTLSSTLLFHGGVGILKFHNPDSAPDAVLEYDAASELGFTGSAAPTIGFPRITGLNSASGGGYGVSGGNMGPGNANKYYNDKLTAVANMTYVRDRHMFKFGGEWKQEVWKDLNQTYSQGQLAFNARADRPSVHAGTEPRRRQRRSAVCELPSGHGQSGRGHRRPRSRVAQIGVELLRAGQLAREPEADARRWPAL